MPWNEVSIVNLRREFVALACQPGVNISQLCRRFCISRKTGYKWLARARGAGMEGFEDRSRQPLHSPNKTPAAMEQAVIALRQQHPEWGGRKLKRRLEDLGHTRVPSPSTITEILRRHGLLHTGSATHQPPWLRFEHEQPNDLWQMDFKGPILTRGSAVHALTVLDDHSRFSLGIELCTAQSFTPTYAALRELFRRYGLPQRMTMDNGNPWGNSHGRWTKLSVWLLDQGVGVSFSRPYHPQTQGKDERFHRTLKAELLSRTDFRDAFHCQLACEQWRQMYNHERPHESLAMAVPASRYRPSERPYQEQVPEFDYGPDDWVRRVGQTGQIQLQRRRYKISEAFAGKPVGIRATAEDGVMAVYYRHQKVATLDLRNVGV
jgi:transposase InsO family protein